MSNSLGSGAPSFLRPKLTLKKWDETSTYYTYDAWNPPGSGPMLTYLDVVDAQGETGEIFIRLEDADKALSANVKNGNKFICEISADGSYATENKFLAGWIREFSSIRKDTGLRDIWMHGYGNMVRWNERIAKFFRIARRQGDGETPDLTDPDMKCSELLKDLHQDPDCLPFGEPAETFTVNGIETINETLASLKGLYVEWSQIVKRLTEASGTVAGIDPSGDVYMRYPTLNHSGITIRDTVNLSVDPEAKTGYFAGPWEATDSMRKDEGFANRLIGIGGTDFRMDVDKFTDSGSDEIYTVDRAVKFMPTVVKLNALALILSRSATLPDNDLQGEIRLDKSNSPTGQQVGTFSVFKNLVGTGATTINRIPVAMSDNRLQADKAYWLVLLAQGDASKHYKWHHIGGSADTWASRSPPGDGGTWTVTGSSKAYCHRTFYTRQVIAEASNPASRKEYSTVEAIVRAPYILEGKAMDTLLDGLLQWSARQRRHYSTNRILAPTTLLKKDTLVRLVDTKEGIDADAEIESVRYTFDADANGLGTRWAQVKLTAYVP